MSETITHTRRSVKPAPVKADVIRLRTQGEAISKIAERLDISVNTVKTILSEAQFEQSTKLSVEQTLGKLGITHSTIAAKLLELTNAKDTRLASFEGKFTDRVDVPDGAIQFRSAEALGKIAGMFPREDTTVAAQLFVRLPDTVLVPGHSETCLCQECRDKWESLPVATPVIEP